MITYPQETYLREFRSHMLDNTAHLGPYVEGIDPNEKLSFDDYPLAPVNYTPATQAYALNITLIYDPQNDLGQYGHIPSADSEIMLVERASGHGKVGEFSGVSGYIDRRRDPADTNLAQSPHIHDGFDPIDFALKNELNEECDVRDLDDITFFAGKWIDFKRTPQENIPVDAMIRIVPVLGVCAVKPKIVPNIKEISRFDWVKLKNIKHFRGLEPGYLDATLPACLGTLGLSKQLISTFLYA